MKHPREDLVIVEMYLHTIVKGKNTGNATLWVCFCWYFVTLD